MEGGQAQIKGTRIYAKEKVLSSGSGPLHRWWSKLPLSSLFQSIFHLCFPKASYCFPHQFEVKVEIIQEMAVLDPTGDWLGRGARALDNPRTATGEESLDKLYAQLEDLKRGGVQSQTFSS